MENENELRNLLEEIQNKLDSLDDKLNQDVFLMGFGANQHSKNMLDRSLLNPLLNNIDDIRTVIWNFVDVLDKTSQDAVQEYPENAEEIFAKPTKKKTGFGLGRKK